MDWEKEEDMMAHSDSDLETDPEQQVDTDCDSGIGDVSSVKYVLICSCKMEGSRGP
jgi:hypothetical protein